MIEAPVNGSFAVYGLAWFGLTMLFVTLLQVFTALLGLQQVMGMAVLPLTMLVSTIFYASLYFSFVDAFDLSDGPDGSEGEAKSA